MNNEITKNRNGVLSSIFVSTNEDERRKERKKKINFELASFFSAKDTYTYFYIELAEMENGSFDYEQV